MSEAGQAITARAIERRFGAVRALRGVDLEVPRGQVVAVFGANGSGKTTLLRVLAGLVRPSSGEVRLFGSTLSSAPSLRRRIGVMAHESFVYDDLTGIENLTYYARLYGVAPARIHTLLAEVGLEDAAHRAVRTYSRGMSQRLSLARTVLHDPDIVLLDEPFTGLDTGGMEVVDAMLRRLRAAGATTLLTTHDFERGTAAASSAIVLHRGRVAWRSDGSLPSPTAMRDLCSRIASGA